MVNDRLKNIIEASKQSVLSGFELDTSQVPVTYCSCLYLIVIKGLMLMEQSKDTENIRIPGLKSNVSSAE